MAEIVNLRMARKARARGKAQEDAAANRAKHGQTKLEKQRNDADVAKVARLLDGARREQD